MMKKLLEKMDLLQHSLWGLQANLARRTLKEGETAPGDPPVLLIDLDLVAEIHTDQSRFVQTEKQVRVTINTAVWMAEKDRRLFRLQLNGLKEEFKKLNLPKDL